ncbi:MAG: hypothetical protein C0508_01210 [Cyanobacteria bacterium PR.023]|nr:hypothetical protein [Cyanobacteria bacterium PR.3.49]MBA4073626.1 hypothetical protein [Cyanobacteria bacterium PR.023]
MDEDMPAGFEDLLDNKPKQIASSIQVDADVPEGFEDLLEPSEQKVSVTGISQEPAPGWQAGYKTISDRLTKGGGTVSRAIAGLNTVFGMSFEEARQGYETSELLQAESDTEDYVNTHGYWDFFKLKYTPPAELTEEGNINLSTRPRVKNADGSISTVRSMSFYDGKSEVLIPTVSDEGRIMSDDEAIQYYKKSGKHLGKFRTPEAATQYAERLHVQQAAMYGRALPPDDNGFKLSPSDIPGLLVEQIPQLAVTGTAAMVGAGLGVMVGNVPGAVAGAAGGAFVANYFISAGNHIYDLQERGADKFTATVAGSLVGTFTAALENFGMGKILRAAPSAATKVVASQNFKDATRKAFGTLLFSAGIDASTEGVESLLESISKALVTRMDDKMEPFTTEEALNDFVKSMVYGAIVSGQIGAATTSVGAGAGWSARLTKAIEARNIKLESERAQQISERQVQSQVQQDKQQAEQIQQATKQGQAKARKALRGFVEVRENLDVNEAMTTLVEAQQNLESATDEDRAVAQLAVKQAQAELRQAKLHSQIEMIEEALTDPDLLTTVREQKAQLQESIKRLEGVIEDANRDEETEPAQVRKLSKRLRTLNRALKEVQDLENLGSEEKVKEEVTRRKENVASEATASRKAVAQAALERRIAERGKVVAKLKADIRQYKQEARENGEEAFTASSRARLEQLNEQQQIDSLLLQMFEEDQITADDIETLAPKIPAARLSGLVKVAQRQIEQAAKTGTKEQKKFTASAKRLLDSVVDLARLPKADKDALSAALLSQDLPTISKALPKLEASIKQQFEKRRLEAARKDLGHQLSLIKVKRDQISKTPGTEELLRVIKDFAEDSEAIERFELNMEAKEILSEQDEAVLELAQLFPVPLEQMTARQIETLIDTIVELRETGKANALRRLDERKARQQKKLDTVLSRIQPTVRGEKRLATVNRKLNKILDEWLNAPSNSWRGLMTIVSQFGELSDMTDVFDVKSANSQMQDMRLKWEGRLQEIVKESGITPGAWHKMLIAGHKRGEAIQYLKAEADEKTGRIVDRVYQLKHDDGRPLTLWEIVQVRNYLLDTDLDAVSRLSQGNRFSYPGEVARGESTLEQVESYLNVAMPGWRPVADSLRQFYREFHSVVDEASTRRFGRYIPMNETYGGELLSSSEPGSRFRERFRRLTTKPGSLHARQGGVKPVEIRGAIDNLMNHIAQYSRESAFMEFEQDAQKVFGDREVRRLIKTNIGDNTLKVIDKHIEDIVLGSARAHDTVSKIAEHLRDSMYSQFLNARPEQFAKQATSIVYALQFVGPKAMMEGYAYMLADPARAAELMSKSGLYRARLQDIPNSHPGALGNLKRFNSFLGQAVKAGDTIGVQGAAFPVLLKTLKETGSEEKAIKAFETAFDTTQSSGSVDEQPAIFRGPALLKVMTALTQQPTRNVEDIVTAWRAYRANPNKETYSHYLRTLVVMYAGAFLYQAVGYMLLYPFMSSDEQEKKLNFILDASILGPFSGVALLGSFLTATMVTGLRFTLNQNTRAFEPELIPVNPLGAMFKAYQKLLKVGTNGGDTEDYWSALLLASSALGSVTGLPTTNVLKKLEPFLGLKD